MKSSTYQNSACIVGQEMWKRDIFITGRANTSIERIKLFSDIIEADAYINVQGDEPFFYPNDLKKLILELPGDQKEVLNMRIYRDMSFKEIAEATGVSINTALGRMRYAIINLRRMVLDNQILLAQ